MNTTTEFMGLRYRTLLDVVLTHAYYDHGYCPHIALEPSMECLSLLRQYRLQWKPKPKGGAVVGTYPAVVPLPSGEAPLVFTFHLTLRDTEFLAVTDWGLMAQQVGNRYFLDYQDDAWEPIRGVPPEVALPMRAIGWVRIPITLEASATKEVGYTFQTPQVTWRYYIVTDQGYTMPLRIMANGNTLSVPGGTDAPEWARVSSRYAHRRVVALSVTLPLQRNLPAWYLVAGEEGNMPIPVADIPPLPKPRPEAAPHLVLDYSSILK